MLLFGLRLPYFTSRSMDHIYSLPISDDSDIKALFQRINPKRGPHLNFHPLTFQHVLSYDALTVMLAVAHHIDVIFTSPWLYAIRHGTVGGTLVPEHRRIRTSKEIWT
jgi:hypothetical protein